MKLSGKENDCWTASSRSEKELSSLLIIITHVTLGQQQCYSTVLGPFLARTVLLPHAGTALVNRYIFSFQL